MPILIPGRGPIPSRVMIVGEAPGEQEELRREPFVGASGAEMNKMLGEAGISRSEAYVTNVCKIRPPRNDISLFLWEGIRRNANALKREERVRSQGIDPETFTVFRDRSIHPYIAEGIATLRTEIESVKPNIIITFGNTSLWALTGKWGITKWRGSMLTEDLSSVRAQLIPTYHPAAILRQWSWRATGVHDLKRAAAFRSGERFARPEWRFGTRPSFEHVCRTLAGLRLRLDQGQVIRISFDLETRHGHIACAGLSWTLVDALCIPFMCTDYGKREGFWPEWEEAEIIWLLCQVLTHPNVRVIGQNIIYDAQYTWRHWHFVPRIVQDTMISWHSIFSDLPKSLAYQASMNCRYYVYWKDEGKEWSKGMGEDQLWFYNCEDCVYTEETALSHLETVKKLKLESVHDFQQKMLWPVLRAMQLGVRVDQQRRKDLIKEVEEQVAHREQFLVDVLGHPLNSASPPQMKKLFYDDLQLPIQYTKATKDEPARPTLNDEALGKLARIQPIVRPIVNCIADIRTLKQFLSNFLRKPLDLDGRMRCSYNIGGSESGKSAPKTYRLSSSENAFGSGTNLQNIPSEKSKSLGKAAARGNISAIGDPYQFPNIRSMFVPDIRYTWFDGDLDRADLQIVVWESGDEMLKAALRMGADIHLMNAFVLEGKEPPPLEELVETHDKYRDHRAPLKLAREFAKVFCHGTNYGGGARTMAAHTGRTVHAIDRAQKLWFGAHPGIPAWHKRVEDQIKRYRFVENRFGYRWYIFDRLDAILPEAIAWIPQSTVSIVINKIWMNLYENLRDEVQVLMQVHDSLCGQFLTTRKEELLPRIREQGRILIPYEDPLIIPFGVKTSETSWGEVK